MFIDTSAIIAILTSEPDAAALVTRMERAPLRVTSALVLLESAMRLSSILNVDPRVVGAKMHDFIVEADIAVVPIGGATARLAIEAFASYGKGRGHPAQLNLADCMSYAAAKELDVPLLYKGTDFARTDLA